MPPSQCGDLCPVNATCTATLRHELTTATCQVHQHAAGERAHISNASNEAHPGRGLRGRVCCRRCVPLPRSPPCLRAATLPLLLRSPWLNDCGSSWDASQRSAPSPAAGAAALPENDTNDGRRRGRSSRAGTGGGSRWSAVDRQSPGAGCAQDEVGGGGTQSLRLRRARSTEGMLRCDDAHGATGCAVAGCASERDNGVHARDAGAFDARRA